MNRSRLPKPDGPHDDRFVYDVTREGLEALSRCRSAAHPRSTVVALLVGVDEKQEQFDRPTQ